MENNIIGIVSGGPMIMNEWVITTEDIPGGHRLIARRGSDVQKLNVMDGKDGTGSGGTVEVDPTLSVEGMAADAAATGAAVAPIAAITETGTSNAITWDGVPVDGVAVDVGEDTAFVLASTYAPEKHELTDQGFNMSSTGSAADAVEVSAETAATMIMDYTQNIYIISGLGLFVAMEDGASVTEEGSTLTFPRKGIYVMAEAGNITKLYLSSPLLAVPTTTVRESAIPDSIARAKDIAKHLVQTDYTENDPASPAYMKNRPFHDAWDSLVLDKTISYARESGETHLSAMEFVDQIDGFVGGSEYTLHIGEEKYTGKSVEQSGVVFIGNVKFFGIQEGYVDFDADAKFGIMYVPQGENVAVIVVALDADLIEGGYRTIIVQGTKSINTVSAPDDIIEIYPVFYRVSDAAPTKEDFAAGYTVTCEKDDGTIVTFTEADCTIVDGTLASEVENGFTIMYGDTRLAWVLNEDVTEGAAIESWGTIKKGTFLHDDIGDSAKEYRCTGLSIKGYTGFRAMLPLKKLDKKFLPDDIGGGDSKIVVVSADPETLKLEKTPAEILALQSAGYTTLFSVTGTSFICDTYEDEGGATWVTASVSAMVPVFDASGVGLLSIMQYTFDRDGNASGLNMGRVDITVIS